jgi:hypothetical protein
VCCQHAIVVNHARRSDRTLDRHMAREGDTYHALEHILAPIVGLKYESFFTNSWPIAVADPFADPLTLTMLQNRSV